MRISDWSSDVCSSDLVARVRERDHHVFRGDQVEDVQVFLAGADLAATVVAELLLDVAQLGTDHLQQYVRIIEDLDQAEDGVQQKRRSEEHTSEVPSPMCNT